jgi:hypothetical protein
MKYGLFRKGKLVRLTRTLKDLLASISYNPWDGLCEVYQFTYNGSNVPVKAVKI